MIHFAILLLVTLLWGLCCSIIGVAVVSVMGSDDTPLSWYFRWANRWQEKKGWKSWVASLIGGCVVCTSGQLGLWSASIILPWSWSPLSIFIHFTAGGTAVLCAFIINHKYAWLKNRI